MTEWRRYMDAVLRRPWVVGVCIVACVAVSALHAVRQPKLYDAKTTVVIETKTPKILTAVQDLADINSSAWSSNEFYAKEYAILASRKVAQLAAENIDIGHDDKHNGLSEIQDDSEREERRRTLDLAAFVLSRVKVEPERKSAAIVSLRAEDHDPVFAAALTNAVADAYVDQNLEKRVDGSKDASTWLAAQHLELKRKLEESEKALHQFMANNDVLNASLESQLDEIKQRLGAFNLGLANVQGDRIRSELDAKALAEVRLNAALLDSLPEIQGAPVISSMKAKLVELTALRIDLAARYKDEHPKLKTLDEQIEQLKQTLNKEIESVLTSLDRKQASIQTTEQGLKAAIAAERQREARLNRLSLEYQRLKREVETNERLYDMVMTRMKEADMTSALPFNNVRVLDRALPARAPFSPNIPSILALGLLLGLFMGFSLAVGIELFDNRIKSEKDIERITSAPFLGCLPTMEAENAEAQSRNAKARTSTGTAVAAKTAGELYVVQHPRSTLAECARFIRTNLMFMSPDRPLKTMVITSAGPSEGKTTTAINLAATMAQAGNRTLIVDTDMRRPRLHRALGFSNDVGISSLIVGEATMAEAIVSTECELLDALMCGPVPPNPSELLHASRFREVVSELSKKYDRIIFDAPPIGAVTDPAILGSMMDGLLFIARSEATTRESLKAAMRTLRDARVHVLGVVLNDINFADKRYGRSYYYYHQSYKLQEEHSV